jgi:Protein of unknown function (DUF1187).
MAYKITAEIKKGWQEWGTVWLKSETKMTEKSLRKKMGTIETEFGKSEINVQIRNFECTKAL